jgi:hypothetical protein
MKNNRYLYGYKVMVNYGHGWEYECFEITLRDAKQRAKEYRANCPEYSVKLSQGRESNPAYNDTIYPCHHLIW